jgi:hypothetical protein
MRKEKSFRSEGRVSVTTHHFAMAIRSASLCPGESQDSVLFRADRFFRNSGLFSFVNLRSEHVELVDP